MIDNRINKSLQDLESSLKNIESARQQVEKTVNSFNGLNKSTNEYVTNLGIITSDINKLVDSIGKDYEQKVQEFENDRKTILDQFKSTLSDLTSKVKYIFIINIVTLVAIIAISIMLLK